MQRVEFAWVWRAFFIVGTEYSSQYLSQVQKQAVLFSVLVCAYHFFDPSVSGTDKSDPARLAPLFPWRVTLSENIFYFTIQKYAKRGYCTLIWRARSLLLRLRPACGWICGSASRVLLNALCRCSYMTKDLCVSKSTFYVALSDIVTQTLSSSTMPADRLPSRRPPPMGQASPAESYCSGGAGHRSLRRFFRIRPYLPGGFVSVPDKVTAGIRNRRSACRWDDCSW